MENPIAIVTAEPASLTMQESQNTRLPSQIATAHSYILPRRRKRTAASGDIVVISDGPTSFEAVKLTPGTVLQNRNGVFKHDDLISVPYGTKVFTKKSTGGRNNNGFLYMLEVSPELWTQVLRHRTQILFSTDIAMVIAQLSLCPGSIVIESGTGSGSLTVALARAIAPHGHVHTFEFNQDRANAARKDFAALGLTDVVTVTHADACRDGFGVALDGTAHGVFLDLPQPWAALPHAIRALRSCGVLCSFSPCIEQVQRTCAALTEAGFEDIRTLETLQRPYEMFMPPIQPSKLDMLNAPVQSTNINIRSKAVSVANTVQDVAEGSTHKRSRLDQDILSSSSVPLPDKDEIIQTAEESLTDEKSSRADPITIASSPMSPMSNNNTSELLTATSEPFPSWVQHVVGSNSIALPLKGTWRRGENAIRTIGNARPTVAVRGHTGYLTFATLYCRRTQPSSRVIDTNSDSAIAVATADNVTNLPPATTTLVEGGGGITVAST